MATNDTLESEFAATKAPMDATESSITLNETPTKDPIITDSIGFTDLSYFAIDEESGIFLAPIQIERRGFNTTSCQVDVIFFNPSYGYVKPEFPLRSNRSSILFGVGETGIKDVPVKILPNSVSHHPLLLQIVLELNVRSSSTALNPLRATSSLLISPKGLATPALQKIAQSYYTEKGLDMVREPSRFQRPVAAIPYSRSVVDISSQSSNA